MYRLRQDAHDVKHLFTCPAHPTTLIQSDLWSSPNGLHPGIQLSRGGKPRLRRTKTSCLLDQHEETASHAECSIENCHRMHTRHTHTTYARKTRILPIHEHLQLHASQYKQKTQHPSHPLHKHTSALQVLKHTIFNNGRLQLHNKHSHIPHTVTTIDIKTNMCHIHTSIVSRHLAIRGK